MEARDIIKGIDKDQMDKWGREVEEKSKKEEEDLRALSKPLHELVIVERFDVNTVAANSYVTHISPHSEMMIGGRSPSYEGGFKSRLVLEVTPNNSDIPVRKLTFEGNSIVVAGNYISVLIPRYEAKGLPGEHLLDRHERRHVFYLPRDFKREESVIQLDILSRNGRVLRTERAVDYDRFVKR